jgi:DNA-binding GntR family transcriptional regulator
MTRAPNPFDRALECLRSGLRDGAYGRGAPLIVVDLARQLRLSPTPVREALSRLAGEGLVTDHRGRGYFAPRHDIGDILQLYQIHLNYIEFALHLQREGDARHGISRIWGKTALRALLATSNDRSAALRDYVEAFYAEIVNSTGNTVLINAHRILADRLAFIRRAEERAIINLQEELERLAELRDRNRLDDLENEIRAYHARRLEVAGRVASAL